MLVVLRSHQLTYALLPAADIPALIESTLGVLLRFVLLPNEEISSQKA
jgi:hypothetical protein